MGPLSHSNANGTNMGYKLKYLNIYLFIFHLTFDTSFLLLHGYFHSAHIDTELCPTSDWSPAQYFTVDCRRWGDFLALMMLIMNIFFSTPWQLFRARIAACTPLWNVDSISRATDPLLISSICLRESKQNVRCRLRDINSVAQHVSIVRCSYIKQDTSRFPAT